MLILLGLIITIIPFILIFCFRNKVLGFLYILTSMVAFHLILGFTTQLLHIFDHQTIISISSILAIVSLLIFYKREKYFEKIKIDYFVIIGFLIIFFQLWSVHFLYKGTVSTFNGYKVEKSTSYSFPYFSDEWVGASLSKYSIENHTLPAVNPLNNNIPAINPLVVFFSFLSEIFLLFNLNPITNFAILPLATGLLICFLSYLFLRVNKINNFVSIVTIVGLTYITNGANLPGIWYLLPYTIGLIMLISSLIASSLKNTYLKSITSFLSLIFYPPIILFIAPIWIFGWMNNIKVSKIVKYITISILVLLPTIFFILGFTIGHFNFNAVIQSFINYLIRPELDNGIPSYAIRNIIPIIFLPMVLLGLIQNTKNKLWYLLAPICTGLIFWCIYMSFDKVIIIEYQRVVAITSILLLLSSGFGLNWLYQKMETRYPKLFQKEKLFYFKILIILLILFFSFSYTNDARWSKLVLKMNPQSSHKTARPAAPANRYLTDDDLELFKNINKKNFISPEWKGLVVGTSTGNFPLDSKSSVITNKILTYQEFTSSDCNGKTLLAKKYNINYAYTKLFTCSNFSFIGHSQEGLFLYQFKQN